MAMLNEAVFQRQLKLVDESVSKKTVCIIGCGGLGSFIALMLLKTGITNFILYDFDDVEEHNIPTQFFRKKDIGKPKVDMLKEQLIEHAPDIINVEAHYERYEISTLEIADIFIPAVDNMTTRSDVFSSLELNMEVELILDPRMGGVAYEIYTCIIEDSVSVKNYMSSLVGEEDIEPLECTAKATVFIAALVAGEITNLARRFLNKEELPRRIVYNGTTNRRLYLKN